MTKGKTICSVLKTIRKQVADANEIKYEPRECHHQGECRGTCLACEAEVRYIEQQLDIRRQLGKAVAVVGLSAGLFALTGCTNKVKDPNTGKDQQQLVVDSDSIRRLEQVDGMMELAGDVECVDTDSSTEKKKCSN
ncbi:MAG: hypothetical protein J6V87_03755 [Prevotella sp.]|nr:hypothetical protein [Prevotella sp.]